MSMHESNFGLLSPKFIQLVDAFTCFQGVGQKTAQRMAMHLLARNNEDAMRLKHALGEAMDDLSPCVQCRMLCEDDVCPICASPHRDQGQVCVVHQAMDLLTLEKTSHFKGRYFVLNGTLSPIDGIDGAALGIPDLVLQAKNNAIREVILATAISAEGEMTAYYIQQELASLVEEITVLAQGVPMGAELEYLDTQTLSLAFAGRKLISS